METDKDVFHQFCNGQRVSARRLHYYVTVSIDRNDRNRKHLSDSKSEVGINGENARRKITLVKGLHLTSKPPASLRVSIDRNCLRNKMRVKELQYLAIRADKPASFLFATSYSGHITNLIDRDSTTS